MPAGPAERGVEATRARARAERSSCEEHSTDLPADSRFAGTGFAEEGAGRSECLAASHADRRALSGDQSGLRADIASRAWANRDV